MIVHFTEFIKKHALFDKEDKILLAFSGGVDSMVMVDLFNKAGFRFGLAHCNFMLRGKDSDLDEETVKAVAQIYNVPVFIERFNTQEFAKSNNLSIEMAARELRYDFFYKLLNSENYNYLATAHHLGDVLETMIFNLTKGTGISGLRGILPKRQQVVRPLLFATKEQITQYAVENKLTWREDQSNELDVYQRNLIRLQVVPHLIKINPGLYESLAKTTAKLRFTEKIYKNYLNQVKEQLVRQVGKDKVILKSELTKVEEPSVLLSEILKEYGFNFTQCENIIDLINKTGAKFLSTQYQLNIDRNDIILSLLLEEEEKSVIIFPETTSIIDSKHSYTLRIIENKNYRLSSDKNSAALDFDRLKYPLTIRNWKQGDRFVPLGMKNKKKLSDFMIDEKIPLNLKRSIKVLVSEGEIAWVVGWRIDDRFKITKETKNILELTVN
jgi:tRNA(Ile)-lysidine synthase